MTTRRTLFRDSDFLKLWAGQSVSMFGSLVSRMALPWTAVFVLGVGAGQMALLQTAELLPALFVGLFAGVWVDRLRRRPILIAADVGRAILLASIPVAAFLHSLSLRQLYVVALLVSVLTVFFDVAYRAYLPALVGWDRVVEGNSKLQASASIAEVSAFGISGVLVQAFSAPGAIVLDALSFVFSAVSVGLIRKPEERQTSTRAEVSASAIREVVEGLTLVWRSRTLRALAGASGILNLSHGITGVMIILFWSRDLHLPASIQGALSAIGGISTFVAALLVQRLVRRWGLGRSLAGGLLIYRLTGFLLALAGGPFWLVLIMLAIPQILGDGAAIVYEINQVSLLQSSVPDRFQGRVMASVRMAEIAGTLLGLAMGGILGQIIGYRWTLLGAAIIGMLAPLWLTLSPVRSIRGAEMTPP